MISFLVTFAAVRRRDFEWLRTSDFPAVLFSVAEPGAIFLWAGVAFFKAAPAASFWQATKESLVVVTKHDLRAIYMGKCDPKKTCINNSPFRSLKWKMLVYGAGAEWSRIFFPLAGIWPNLVGAAVGSVTSDFRSRPKKWRHRNTGSVG